MNSQVDRHLARLCFAFLLSPLRTPLLRPPRTYQRISSVPRATPRHAHPHLPLRRCTQVRKHAACAMPDADSVTPDQVAKWRPHRLHADTPMVGPGHDWITPVAADLHSARDFRVRDARHPYAPRVLVLYGTLRPAGFSKLVAFECARLLDACGLDVRVFDPAALPMRDPALSDHPKVRELRELVEWSEAHVWSAAELHGNLCSVFKNQIDWIPLNSGSVRPTQGKSCAVLQVCGGSQSFNVVNTLRLLARWMRMPCIVNQSSVPMAWKEFDDHGRMKEGALRDRVVDVIEEFVKFVHINREYADFFTDRYSERKERMEKGRLLTQAEKEAEKEAAKLKRKANE